MLARCLIPFATASDARKLRPQHHQQQGRSSRWGDVNARLPLQQQGRASLGGTMTATIAGPPAPPGVSDGGGAGVAPSCICSLSPNQAAGAGRERRRRDSEVVSDCNDGKAARQGREREDFECKPLPLQSLLHILRPAGGKGRTLRVV